MQRATPELLLRVRGHVMRRGIKPQLGDGQVYAYVNHGRWVADCPCGGAELVTESEPMLCGSCGHIRNVVWPENVEVIESMLEERPDRKTQNWLVGETVDQLEAEVR